MGPKPRPLLDRMEDKILVLVDVPCWFWIGALNGNGYGNIGRRDGGSQQAHRVLYETHVGPIPAGLEPDHLCDNSQCVNPAHLEPVTHAENIRRAFARITHCPQGHAYTVENTIWHSRTDRTATRDCRICKHVRDDRARARLRGAQGRTKRIPKITPSIAALIRQRSAEGASQPVLARQFGISQTSVWAVLRGKLWMSS